MLFVASSPRIFVRLEKVGIGGWSNCTIYTPVFRLLEEMYKLGYDPVISSDLVRCFDNATIFFQKVNSLSLFFSLPFSCKSLIYLSLFLSLSLFYLSLSLSVSFFISFSLHRTSSNFIAKYAAILYSVYS